MNLNGGRRSGEPTVDVSDILREHHNGYVFVCEHRIVCPAIEGDEAIAICFA